MEISLSSEEGQILKGITEAKTTQQLFQAFNASPPELLGFLERVGEQHSHEGLELYLTAMVHTHCSPNPTLNELLRLESQLTLGEQDVPGLKEVFADRQSIARGLAALQLVKLTSADLLEGLITVLKEDNPIVKEDNPIVKEAIEHALKRLSPYERGLISEGLHFPKGYALHIGINKVDPSYYKNFIPPLAGCVNDMERMAELAASLQFEEVAKLANLQATKEAIEDAIGKMAGMAMPDDLVLITYAGHGAPIPDLDGDEADTYDEAWVTANGFLLDDTLNQWFTTFKSGVRILLVSDSCHSGTMARALRGSSMRIQQRYQDQTLRYVSLDLVEQVLAANASSLNALLNTRKHTRSIKPMAAVKLLAACQDYQFAGEKQIDGAVAGLFTTQLLKVIEETQGSRLNYAAVMEQVVRGMPPNQVPQVKDEGASDPTFDAQYPFTIRGGSSHSTPGSSTPEDILSVQPSNQQIYHSIVVETEQDFVDVARQVHTRSTGGEGTTRLKVVDKEVDPQVLVGRTAWDKAYNLYLGADTKRIAYVEPDIPADVYLPPESMQPEPAVRSTDPNGWLSTYPPEADDAEEVPFDWHLSNEHSQLRAAREIVFPELISGDTPDLSQPLVRIAHIDTGYIPGHPALPKMRVGPEAVTAPLWGDISGTGIDKDKRLDPTERQGHGTATLALLAGGYVTHEHTANLFEGYFGACPFAKVFTIRVSDTVALLSGKRFAKAIDHAIELNVDVVTMSMAGWPSRVMASAINRAYNAGIVVVCAAGNSWAKSFGRVSPKTVLYPGRFDRTIAAVGATYSGVPYVWGLHNDTKRDQGGANMQMSYGPARAMRTAIAGYTPNIIWFGRDDKKKGAFRYFVKTGGGTSSATPQVAAAAALYIQKHRDELDRIVGDDAWKKVEIVKRALFTSAKKVDTYKKYYGQGVLRAKDALALTPSSLATGLTKARRAKAPGSFLTKLFTLYSRRSVGGSQDQKLAAMMQTELTQLLHREPALHDLLQYDLTDDTVVLTDRERALLYEVVQTSEHASDFLKQHIKPTVIPSGTQNRSLSSGQQTSVVELASDAGRVNLRTSGLDCRLLNYTKGKAHKDAEAVIIDEIELLIAGTATRSSDVSLDVRTTLAENERQGVLLVETEVEGGTLKRWVFEDTEQEAAKRSARNTGAPGYYWFGEQGFRVEVGVLMGSTVRGNWLGKVGKVVLRLISWKKPSSPNVMRQWLKTKATDRYALMVYDLHGKQDDGTKWVRADQGSVNYFNEISKDKKPVLAVFPGLFRTVEDNFTDFLRNPDVLKHLRSKHCRYVLGFNMPTVAHGIEDNAKTFDSLLSGKLVGKSCNVLARSRGGVVSRYLFEHLWKGKKASGKQGAGNKNTSKLGTPPLLLGNMVMLGTPNEGTPIANEPKWTSLVNVSTNLLGKLFVVGSPIFEAIRRVAAAAVEGLVDLPGIDDLEVNSKLMQRLNKDLNTTRPNYYVAASDYEPRRWFLRLLDEGAVDRYIFARKTNDMVVPVKSAFLELNEKTAAIPTANRLPIGSHRSLHHFEYVDAENEDIIAWILKHLK